MDQVKIGSFLKELRNEKHMTQEQLGEKFNISSRTVSRWETGRNMPDISLLIELAEYYEIDIRELLNGERKSEKMEENLKETLKMVVDYTEEEKEKIMNRVYYNGLGATCMFAGVLILYIFNLYSRFDWAGNMLVCFLYIGAYFSISNIIAGLQLRGKMTKQHLKTMVKVLVPVCVALTFLMIIIILLLTGIA